MIFGEKTYLVEILGKKLGDCTCCCWGNLTEKVYHMMNLSATNVTLV